MTTRGKALAQRLVGGYSMLLVLLLLCAIFSVLTYQEQHPTGATAAQQLAATIVDEQGASAHVLIAAGTTPDEVAFADKLQESLGRAGVTILATVKGDPRDARREMARLAGSGARLDIVACSPAASTWLVFADLASNFPLLRSATVMTPRTYRWPTFLNASNLLNIANQIAVIAIVAIGMTMVIITGGIDLSVGSLIALAAVTTACAIRDFAGGLNAAAPGMTLACVAGAAVCSAVGLLSGLTITMLGIPPFIVTLAMMLVASGIAYILAQGQSVYQIPESFVWLGRGADLWHIPNAVLLMLALYLVAHVLMTRMTLGRYLYAVGGNKEAARLSGVPVQRVLVFAYTVSGLLAGLGGIMLASQLKSGSPTYGQMYELYTIAAVVVGGTSLSGGEGSVSGTLIGAFIIAVIQNGMNLTNVEPYTQKVVLGMVILAAVILDRLKHGFGNWPAFLHIVR